ncbi:hypothetical protein AXF42_Ash009093 [Apostasia shenzhenica]|uniref:Uncharacterized protein n=1 Tax=Apostasia shenzhenica TaxID=1088818 RepID=A0A2I0ADG6_9ASPA|nr:hypothetical protein AXF42_Ash009093 [Apostasia shenzhenica]
MEQQPSPESHSAVRSVETLVVVVAVIIIFAVLAGMLARVCGGRHLASAGDHDVEGCVESKCRSCIDSAIPPPPPPAGGEADAGEVKK